MSKPITQSYTEHDWQTQQRQQRRLHMAPNPTQKKESILQTLKLQATDDKITITLEIVCICMLIAVIAAQAGIYWNC